jgi:hypothetical protein
MENIDRRPPWKVEFKKVTLKEYRYFADNHQDIPQCIDPGFYGIGTPKEYFVDLEWASGKELSPYNDSLPDSAYLVMCIAKKDCPLEKNAKTYAENAWETLKNRKIISEIESRN